jgi:hypothetical protein
LAISTIVRAHQHSAGKRILSIGRLAIVLDLGGAGLAALSKRWRVEGATPSTAAATNRNRLIGSRS